MEIAVLGNGKLVNSVMKKAMAEYYSWVSTIGPDGSKMTDLEMYV